MTTARTTRKRLLLDEMGDPTALVEMLRAEGYSIDSSDYAANELRFLHRQAEDALRECIERAQKRLDDLRSDDPAKVWSALIGMDSGAGASGPPDTQYVKAVRCASRITGIVNGFRAGNSTARERGAVVPKRKAV